MKKIMGLAAALLAGLMVIPGNLWFASQAMAQSEAKTNEDKQLQDLRQKRIETLQEQTGRRNNCKIQASATKTPSIARRMPSSAKKPSTRAWRTLMKKRNEIASTRVS